MNNAEAQVKYHISLSFEEIKLPPFENILILARNSVQGKIGLSKSFELLLPNGFDVTEVNEGNVEAVFINRKILNKISKDKILEILRTKVFPFTSEGELLKVNVNILISYDNIEYDAKWK